MPDRAVAGQGTYLTDGRRLFRVVDGFGESMLLEDCARPEDLPSPWSAVELARLVLVVPAVDVSSVVAA